MENLIKDKEFVRKTIKRISNEPLKKDSHFYGQFKEMKIIDAVNNWAENQNPKDSQPAIIFLRVVLAANRKYNTHVKPNIDRIIEENPSLTTFKSLKKLIESKTREEFYEFWGHKNLKKYNTLVNLIEATDQIRLKYNIQDDFKLMHKWAENIDIYDYENDIIGRIKNIAIATLQHLRMDFGINTIKPDQRVIEVLEREFNFKKVNQIRAIKLVEEMANISEISVRNLDLVLVNYGSGYYDNRKYNSQLKVKKEIANKLLNLGVDRSVIFEATGIIKK
jgi:predicted house-cleaning noncanonical NTP pyrophosphatase (MazG superfamily)